MLTKLQALVMDQIELRLAAVKVAEVCERRADPDREPRCVLFGTGAAPYLSGGGTGR
jgi:hypothetical protein